MTQTRYPDRLADLFYAYDVLLVDIWGVLHNGREPFKGAVEACRAARVAGKTVVLISNSPKPHTAIPGQFAQIGVPMEVCDAIVTSGDATRDVLKARAPGPAFKLSPPKDDVLYEGLGLEFADENTATFVSCSGPFDDLTETPDDYVELFEQFLARGLDMVCANPDLIVQHGNRLIYCGGALAERYALMGGEVVYAGKPHPPIYALALETASRLRAAPINRARVLCIGDGPGTDIAGANREGLDVMFVDTGIGGKGSNLQHTVSALTDEGRVLTHAMPGLH